MAGEVPSSLGPAWSEEDEQDVRPYTLTRGRTRPRHRMRLASLLAAGPAPADGSGPEAVQAWSLCSVQPRSVAELAALLQQPVLVAKVVLSDLIDCGALFLAVPDTAHTAHTDPQLLEAVLAGLQRRFRGVEAV